MLSAANKSDLNNKGHLWFHLSKDHRGRAAPGSFGSWRTWSRIWVLSVWFRPQYVGWSVPSWLQGVPGSRHIFRAGPKARRRWRQGECIFPSCSFVRNLSWNSLCTVHSHLTGQNRVTFIPKMITNQREWYYCNEFRVIKIQTHILLPNYGITQYLTKLCWGRKEKGAWLLGRQSASSH